MSRDPARSNRNESRLITVGVLLGIFVLGCQSESPSPPPGAPPEAPAPADPVPGSVAPSEPTVEQTGPVLGDPNAAIDNGASVTPDPADREASGSFFGDFQAGPGRGTETDAVKRPVPEWLEARAAAQRATVSQFHVFHDFQFEDRIDASGIRFRHRIVDDAGKVYKAVHYDHGNGVAIADVDGDGRQDIYFVTQVGRNELWRNVGAGKINLDTGSFQDITEQAGVALANSIGVSASFADTDNDGDADLFVTTVRGGNVLFENDGRGRFTDITESAGVGYTGHSSAAVFFDYNRDGLLDLFVANVGVYTSDESAPANSELPASRYYVGFKDAFAGHLKPEREESSILYQNLGGNRFENVTEQTGLVDVSWSGDASPLDVNEDGWPDLYVLNMQGHDEYYENEGGEKFVKKSRQVFPKTAWGAMGIKVFDFNNDGRMDIYITDMHSDMAEDIGPEDEKLKSAAMRYEPESLLRSGGMSIYGNAFYRNEGNGKYTEISDQIGAENYWPWGLSVGDLNADGYVDAFVASSMNYPFRYGVNSVLLNDQGQTFLDSEFILGVEPRRNMQTEIPWFRCDCDGADRAHRECEGQSGQIVVWGALGTRSSVIFDIDQDGDLDIVTNEFNSPPMVLVSNLSEKTQVRFLKVKLVGTQSNKSGIGAKVIVRADGQTFTKVHDGQSGYLSQSLCPLYFGLGKADSVDAIEVIWPSGVEQSVTDGIEVNRLIEVVETHSG